jgi:D-aspartate ligase
MTAASHPATKPPVIVLGGGHNSLSIARQLGSRGVSVHALNHVGSDITRSRFARKIRLPGKEPFHQEAAEYLVGPASEALRGSVLLVGSDEGLRLVAAHREQLSERFLLDLSNPEAQVRMLDKLATYRAARDAGVPVPDFWTVKTTEDAEAVRSSITFPIIVKPHLSYLFEARTGKKFVEVSDFDALARALDMVQSAGTEALLMEKIPGPDSLLCSYYTYLDEDGNALFDFTKRIIRRYPKNMGLATHHVTDVIPELREPSLRLFQHVGLRGVTNVEFKLDQRDKELKLIECNARFTAANGLLAKSGLDLAWFVYSRIVGLPLPDMSRYRSGARLWDPTRDFLAYRELRRLGELSFGGWLKSIAGRRTFPVFSVTDPWPSVRRAAAKGKKLFKK